MNVQQKTKQKGFSIIEVVLVLAIAGLIFLMVFIALPALQRNQRDTQRKNDLSRAQTAIQNFQSNNRNRLPTNWGTGTEGLAARYLKANGSGDGADADAFVDPNRGDYEFAPGTEEPTYDEDRAVIQYAIGYTCNGESLDSNGATKVALRMKLEGGGVACVNN